MNCKTFETLIDSYLDGTIAEKDIESFEEHYFTCDKCFYLLKLRENLFEKKVSVVLDGKRSRILGSFLKPALILSSLLIVFFSTFFFFEHKVELKKIERISSFTPPVFISSETRDDNFNRVFENAMTLYKESDFQNALKVILKTDEEKPKVVFFKGILYLINNKPKEAISYFEEILNKMDPSYFDESIYYKSIALLKLNRKKKSLKELNKLSGMYSPLSEKAKILIEKIEKL